MSKKTKQSAIPETNLEAQDLSQAETELIQEAQTQDEVVETLDKPKKQGIGKEIVKLLKAGVEPKKVLEEILEKFGSKTTMACVYWYKSKINKGFY